jgi:hypothetical protein
MAKEEGEAHEAAEGKARDETDGGHDEAHGEIEGCHDELDRTVA